MPFKVGDWVVVKKGFDGSHIKKGMIGKVVCDGYTIGVEFVDFISNTNCSSWAKEGHGWWIWKENIKYLKKITEKEAVLYAL